MVHLLGLCSLQVSRGEKSPPTILIQSVCHVVLRPPWDAMMCVVTNTQAHMRVLDTLLRRVDWGVY